MKHILLITLIFHCFACSLVGKKKEQNRYQVIDQGALFSDKEELILRQKVQWLEDSIGSQICVFTISTTGEQSIEVFSLEKTEDLRLGREGYDDGILITVASEDRKVRIEVGYGLENIVRDEIASAIIRELMIPNFVDGNYFAGVSAGIDSISHLIVANQVLIGSEPTWPGQKD